MGGGELGRGGGDTGLASSGITFPFLLCELTGSSCNDKVSTELSLTLQL